MNQSVSMEYYSYYNMKIIGYVDLTCCVIMVISNALLILVLARRKRSPTSTIFFHMAITETLSALAYTPRVWHEFIRATPCSIPEHRTYAWEEVSVYSYIIAFGFRSMTVWMAGMLAVARYVAVLHPLKARILCSMKTTRKFVILGYLIGAALAIPIYFSIGVEKTGRKFDQDGCLVTNGSSGQHEIIYEFKIPIENHPFWYNAFFISYFILKVAPSLAFAIVSYKLIIALNEAKRTRRNMTITSYHNNKTTISLIIIFILIIPGEVPNGIGVLFNVLYGPEYFWKHYVYEMEVFNCLAFISGSWNFFIYYAISDRFRQNFKEVFVFDRTGVNIPPTENSRLICSPFIRTNSSFDKYYNSI